MSTWEQVSSRPPHRQQATLELTATSDAEVIVWETDAEVAR